MFHTVQIAVGGFDSNFSYLVVNGNAAAVVDPCGDVSKIRSVWERERCATPFLKACCILLTHSHRDHVSGIAELKTFFKAPVCASQYTAYPCDRKLSDGERLPFGDGFIECIVTQGHTSDSVCYRTSDDSALFTGDTLFVGCCGFCQPEPMFRSMNRLKTLSDSLTVYSGHDYGATPYDTLGNQKKVNPYLSAETMEEFRERLRHLE